MKPINILVTATLCLVMIPVSHSWAKPAAKPRAPAAEPAPAPAPAGDGGEVDISDIQQQYWKAHDQQFEVIQNRRYSKKHHVELTPVVGIYQRIDFQDTMTYGFSTAFHFSEMLGIELTAYKMWADDSTILKTFQERWNATVEYNTEKFYYGVGAIWSPIYAKFSFLGTKISHFDMYVTPALGVTRTNANRITPSVGIGQKFWLGQRFNLRVEYRWSTYKDRVYTETGATSIPNGGPGYFDQWVNNYNLLMGIGFLF